MQYAYRVKDKSGKILAGIVNANSTEEALKILRERDVFVLSIKKATHEALNINSEISFFSHIPYSLVVDFTRQLATMLNAGLSLVESISLLAKSTKNQAFRKILNDILTNIKSGTTLSYALSQHPKQFRKMYTALVAAGEKSGKLDVILLRLADTLEADRAFKSHLKTAMIYPTIVIIGMIALATLMMVVVVPQLTEIYDQFDVELPLTTQILIGVSKFTTHSWWVILLIVIGLFLWLPRFKSTKVGGQIIDYITLNIPIWGSLKHDNIMTELTRTLSLLIGAGVPILESLDIAADTITSTQYSNAIKDAARKVERGFQLGSVISANPLFPPIFGQMINVGEQTGKTDETLGRISRYFELSSSEKVKRLTATMEPIILGVLGIGVGFLVFSIVMPMYQLTQAF